MQVWGRTWALLEDMSDLCTCWPHHDGYWACPCGPASLVQVPSWMLRSTSSLQCPVSCSLPPGHRTCSPQSAPPQDMRLCSAGCSGENHQLSQPFPRPAQRLSSTFPCPPWLHSHSARPARHQRDCPELKPQRPPAHTFTGLPGRPQCSPGPGAGVTCSVSPQRPQPAAPCTQHPLPTACGWRAAAPAPVILRPHLFPSSHLPSVHWQADDSVHLCIACGCEPMPGAASPSPPVSFLPKAGLLAGSVSVYLPCYTAPGPGSCTLTLCRVTLPKSPMCCLLSLLFVAPGPRTLFCTCGHY